MQGRGRIVNVVLYGVLRPSTDPVLADRALLGHLARQWGEQLLPRHQHIVARYEREVEAATSTQLRHMVDTVGALAGEYLFSLAIVGGAAWKMEGCLATFVRKHLAGVLESGVQVPLRGLPDAGLTVPADAVQSVDWYWPTAGDQLSGRDSPDAALEERRQRVADERERAEAACRRALADRAAALARFETLQEVAQRYARQREEQARWFTLGWPLLRRCVLKRLQRPLKRLHRPPALARASSTTPRQPARVFRRQVPPARGGSPASHASASQIDWRRACLASDRPGLIGGESSDRSTSELLPR